MKQQHQKHIENCAQWTGKWFKWLMEIPTSNNPANNDMGKNCAVNQTDGNVWFLAGTPGGRADHTCTIPTGKAILFPVYAADCSYAEYPKLKVEPKAFSAIELLKHILRCIALDTQKCNIYSMCTSNYPTSL
jgi:hypothetical protein